MSDVSPASRRLADLCERDRRTLELTGLRAARRIGTQARLFAINALRTGNDPRRAIRDVLLGNDRLDLPGMAPLLADAMLAGHLKGKWRSTLIAAPQFRASGRQKLARTAYDDAMEFLLRRLLLSEGDLEALRQTYAAEAMRVTRHLSTQMELAVQEALVATTQRGTGVKDGVKALRQAFADEGIAPDADHVLTSIFRTQTQLAYGAGRWNSLQAPEVQEILWGYEFVTTGDDGVRPTHAAMDGYKAPKGDPVWSRWWAPVGFNCRCTNLEVFDKGEKTEQMPDVEPDPGFAFNAGQVFVDFIRPRTR